MAPYRCLLLAPAEGWWPLATWRALWALWIAVKKKWTPIFFIGGPHLYPPCHHPPYPLHRFFYFFLLLPYQFLFQSDNFSILPHILPQILPQTTISIAIHPPTTFSVPKRNTGKCFERPAKILRGMQSSVPKRNTGKCLLTVGTDVKNMTQGRGTEGNGGEGYGGEGRRGPGSVFYVDFIDGHGRQTDRQTTMTEKWEYRGWLAWYHWPNNDRNYGENILQ